jgi:hypothetical protein
MHHYIWHYIQQVPIPMEKIIYISSKGVIVLTIKIYFAQFNRKKKKSHTKHN